MLVFIFCYFAHLVVILKGRAARADLELVLTSTSLVRKTDG